ncbi:MAG: hypothetical protein GY756_22905 [bacterium]|nr:hypothetical protein [bacterium]
MKSLQYIFPRFVILAAIVVIVVGTLYTINQAVISTTTTPASYSQFVSYSARF